MKKSTIILVLFLLNCKPDEVLISDLIKSLEISPKEIYADGSSVAVVEAVINSDADPDKRTVIFKTNFGSFVENNDSIISKKAEFTDGKLVARVNYKAPAKAGTAKIQAQLDIPGEYRDYKLTNSVKIKESSPVRLKLTSGSFGVMVDFANEVKITGTLLNNENKLASQGYKVILEDEYVNGTEVNGRFRELQLTSGATSTISALYSPGFVEIGKDILIRATLVNSDGNRTDISDSVVVTTIPK